MNVTFLPQGKCVTTKKGESLLDVCKRADISLGQTCNGRGTCKKCTVVIDWEEKLACQVNVTDDMEVIVPYAETKEERGQNSKKEEISKSFFKQNEIAADELAKKNETLKKEECYGVALDIGTTTIVASFVDLHTKKVVSVVARENPQRSVGADVISRIEYTEQNEGNLRLLQEMILDCCEEMIDSFSIHKRGKIKKIAVVGNPTMNHIFLGYSPSSLARYPFSQKFETMQIREGKSLKEAVLHGKRDNQVINARVETACEKKPKTLAHSFLSNEMQVFVFPNIGGQVGSDLAMGLLATHVLEKEGNYIVIDIGTNAEMALAQDGTCVVCSAAAGPVFEGASIANGMRAMGGAIERVTLGKHGDVSIKTIDDKPAVGLCGSGLIEAVALLLQASIVTRDGYMLQKEEAIKKGIPTLLCNRLVGRDEEKAFCLVPNKVFITQEDIRQVQLAKGAIRAGIVTLQKEKNITINDIDEIFVAGAFGTYLNKAAAKQIGLLPDISNEKIKMAGNTASIGAVMALSQMDVIKKACHLPKQISFVELATHPGFQQCFLESLDF